LLTTHDKGRTFAKIQSTLDELGYHHETRVLNALNFGLPQKRERTFIVGFAKPTNFEWPEGNLPMKTLDDVLEDEVPAKYYASAKIQESRKARIRKPLPKERTIWHENRSGNVSANPFSCALRAGASYSYLLVDGVRRPTEREMLRLQGFPENFKLVTNYSESRKQAGNAVPVPMVGSVIESVFLALKSSGWTSSGATSPYGQLVLT
jgi:DNA (cytosine-5)-methyltransferase 1